MRARERDSERDDDELCISTSSCFPLWLPVNRLVVKIAAGVPCCIHPSKNVVVWTTFLGTISHLFPVLLISMRALSFFSACCFFAQQQWSREKMALKNDSSAENTICIETKSVPNPAILSWCTFTTQTPFLRPSNSGPNSNSNYKLSSHFVRPSVILRDLRCSVMSTADKCFRFLLLFASQNPLLDKVLSLSSQFQGFCQQVTLNFKE